MVMAARHRSRPDDRPTVTVLRGRAALYARQSITREGSASLDVQVEACREAAARLELEVVAELVEAPSTSGYTNRGRSRPKFGELLNLIRRGEVDCVVAYKTDRLSRGGGPGWAPLVDAFEAAGRDPDRAVATTDGWVSEFEIGIRSAMDREESKKTSDRMQAVRAREAKEGVPRPGGRRPYGFSVDMSEHVVCEVKRIHEAADRVLAGESVWSICTGWNKLGVPTVTGRPSTVQTLTGILTSPRIAGFRTHRGKVAAKVSGNGSSTRTATTPSWLRWLPARRSHGRGGHIRSSGSWSAAGAEDHCARSRGRTGAGRMRVGRDPGWADAAASASRRTGSKTTCAT